MEVQKFETGIDGLDEVLGGGIPKGHVVLITGMPGTMKSSLAYAILYNCASNYSSRGLYLSLEQSRRSLCQQMKVMGFDVDAVEGRVHVVDVGSIQKEAGGSASKLWMDFLRKMLENKKKVDGVDLIVIDSLEALEVLSRFENRRMELFRFFEWLRGLEATSFVLTEAPPEQILIGIEQNPPGNEEGYLSDGILHLKMHQVSDVNVQRRIRVVKLRSANHKTGFYALVFEDGRFSVTRALSV